MEFFLIEKSLGSDEHLIKSVWETEGTAPSPPKQRSRAEHGFFVLLRQESELSCPQVTTGTVGAG